MRPTHNPSGFAIMVAILLVALAIFIYSVRNRLKLVTKGGFENRWDQIHRRIAGVLVYVLGQKRMFDEKYPGVMHVLIFWGFVMLSFWTITFVGEGLRAGYAHPIVTSRLGPIYISFVDIFELLVIIGVVMAFWRRLVTKPDRLTLNFDGLFALIMILTLMVSDIFVRGLNLVAESERVSGFTPMAFIIQGSFQDAGPDTLKMVNATFWWIHLSSLLVFLVYLPFSKHFHIFTAVFNVFFRSLKPKGALVPIDLEEVEEFGVSRVDQYTWKQLLDLYICTECGRCQSHCPAWLSDKPLSPKNLIVDLKHHLHEKGPYLNGSGNGEAEGEEEGPALISEEAITEDVIWSCTTCRGCEEHCPVFIEHINKIVDMRRHLTMMESKFDPTVATTFRNMERNGNPWGFAAEERLDWAEGLDLKVLADDNDVDILYWVGCAGSFDDANKKVAQAMVKLLNAAGVNFGVLGMEEMCTGDAARRLGNEYLFQMMAMQNVETLNGYGVKKIVTACPHCFNTLKHEYPQFDGNYEVYHHTEFIADLIKKGRLQLNGRIDEVVSYHDSCYLGRYNEIYNAPRDIVNSLSGTRLVEMERNRKGSFCCGGGGGHMWMEIDIGERVNVMRVEELLKAEPTVAATACPFCLSMFEDGVKAKDAAEKVKILDLAQLVEQAL
jgi:Fe-S oxidoreductase/nitrate reductase gamma subunit